MRCEEISRFKQHSPTPVGIREDLTEGLGEVVNAKVVMTIHRRRPRGSAREETSLSFTRLLPSGSLLQVLCCRLLDSEPPVREVFCFAPNEPQPMTLLPGGNTVRFGKNAWERSAWDSHAKHECTNQ